MKKSVPPRAASAANNAAGFTLVETLAALAVLTIGLVGVLILTSSMLQQAGLTVEMDRCCLLARSKIAQLITDGGFVEGNEEGTFEEVGEPGFNWKTGIKAAEDANELYEVTVTVWKEDSPRRWKLVTMARELVL